MKDSSDNEDVLEGVQVEGRYVTLDLGFLFNTFLRDGNEFHFKVVRGLPDGAKAIAAGIINDALVMVFDTDVPNEVWFEDQSRKVKIQNKDLN
jgi:hypothetical protein